MDPSKAATDTQPLSAVGGTVQVRAPNFPKPLKPLKLALCWPQKDGVEHLGARGLFGFRNPGVGEWALHCRRRVTSLLIGRLWGVDLPHS